MKGKDLFITISFLAIIFLLMAFITLFRHGNDYTYFENRILKEKPILSLNNVFNNHYFDELESYFKDSFKGRIKILKLDTLINMNILKRPVVNGIYKADDIYMSRWKRWWPYDYHNDLKDMTNGLKSLNDNLIKQNIKFIYVGVPEHGYVFSDKYPGYLLNKFDEWKEIEDAFFSELNKIGITNIKCMDIIKDRNSEYTKTDHHFSFIGAKNVYDEIIKKINEVTNYNLNSDVELIKTDIDFRGSYARKLFFVGSLKDDLYIYKPDFSFKRFDDGEPTREELFFIEDNMFQNSVGYGVYMNGDKGITKIVTNRKNLPNILVYGDSFTNPIEALLVRNANNFYSVDFRYKKDKNLSEIIAECKPDIVILIRDNLMYLNKEDNGIVK